jgi:ribose 1,5-bisphosphokinase PhnN
VTGPLGELVPKELSAVLDIPVDVARAVNLDMQETWSSRLTVPIKVQSEVLERVERFFDRGRNVLRLRGRNNCSVRNSRRY